MPNHPMEIDYYYAKGVDPDLCSHRARVNKYEPGVDHREAANGDSNMSRKTTSNIKNTRS